MWRHCIVRRELHDRIRSGQIGDLITLRAYRMHGPIGSFPPTQAERHLGLVVSDEAVPQFSLGQWRCYSDFYIHNIDECCWMKGAWPVKAQATGGRHYRGNFVDQNFDSYSVEYTFEDGVKLFLYGRCIGGCYDEFGSYAHGSKSLAVISIGAGTPSKSAIYRDKTWLPRNSSGSTGARTDTLPARVG